MIKLVNTTGTTLTASGAIPLTVKYNTNPKTSFNSTTNAISINQAGYYKIDADFVVTATATGDLSIQLYADGVAIPEAIATHTLGTVGNIVTLAISDVERIIKNYTTTDKVALTFVASGACTITNANVSVIEIR